MVLISQFYEQFSQNDQGHFYEFKKCQTHRTFGGGGGWHSLIEVRGKQTLRLLPRAVQQLNLLPTVHMVSHFLHPRADKKLHFHSPIVPQLSKCLKFEAVRGN